MNTERAFLDDIIASPEDDAPRLIFADWLEDHGDPDRAEFIRLQVARAKGGNPEAVGGRERELLDANRTRWTEGLEGRADQALFRRGFVEGLWAQPSTMKGFQKGLAQLCRSFPVRLLRLESPKEACLQAVVRAV